MEPMVDDNGVSTSPQDPMVPVASNAIPDQQPGVAIESTPNEASYPGTNHGSNVIGSAHIRPVFFGNLDQNCIADDIEDIFLRPSMGSPIPIDRVDLKRGFCFVFLQDAKTQEDKDRVEQYVNSLNGMNIPKVSKALRAEFARGDGRIKRKEDDRRKKIIPNETLFIVNFHEETTKREDLEMLFSPFGELVRIDMKKNFAFVQFTNIENATKAKEATNGGKLDQSVITVEYVAQRMRDERGSGRRDRDRYDRDRDRGYRRSYDGRGGYRRDDDYPRRRDDDYRRRDDRYDDHRGLRRERSPPRDRYDDYRRGRSRSRSPVYRYRSRSPSPRRDRGGRGGYDRRSDRDYRDAGRARSSERDYRGGDVGRGYK